MAKIKRWLFQIVFRIQTGKSAYGCVDLLGRAILDVQETES